MTKEKEVRLIKETVSGCNKCPYLRFLRIDLASNPFCIGKYMFYCGKDYDVKKEHLLTISGCWGDLKTPSSCPLERVSEQQELCGK